MWRSWQMAPNATGSRIAVRGLQGTWEDISLLSDQDLLLHTASLCYRLRLVEQEFQPIAWSKD